MVNAVLMAFVLLPYVVCGCGSIGDKRTRLRNCASSTNKENVVVNTTLGPVEGAPSSAARCATFYGIPYAAPPVGDLRFRPPQAKLPWTSPRPAFAKKYIGKSCLQVQ